MPDSLTEATTRIPFCGSPNPTLGVELEVQIVDPATWNLTSGSTHLLDRLGHDHPKIKQELTQSTIEVITGICDDVDEAVGDIRASLKELYEAADQVRSEDGIELTFASAGTHPFAQWREQSIFPNDRYQMLVDRIQWPARRLMIYGLHVHVGVGSGEKAIAIANHLTTFIPHMLALSASSPFIDFEDTGLASARTKIFEGMPTAGLPYRLANYGEFQSFMNTLIKARAIQTIREIWWDIRPHPAFGTIEVRVCDAPTTLHEMGALVALVQSLVVWLDHHYEEGLHRQLLKPWIVRENKWRATRFGLDADVIKDNEGTQLVLREAIPELCETLHPFARERGCPDELERCHTIISGGASYERQRAAFSRDGRLEDIVHANADQLRAEVLG